MKNQSTQDLENSLDFLWVELTNKCNLKCVHCYADSSPYNPLEQKISLDSWIDIIAEASSTGCRKIQFIGGEPTLYPELDILIRKSSELGFEFIEVYTNGFNISEKLFDVFKEYKVNLAFSVYGHNNEIHESITQRRSSFEKTITNIKKALSLELTIRVSIVEMDLNHGEIENTIDYLKSIGCTNIGTDGVRGIGRGEHKLDSEVEDPMEELCGACWQGQLVVDSNGDIFPCVFSRFNKVGHISDSFDKILKQSSLTEFRSKVKLMDERRRSESEFELVDSESPQMGNCNPYCNPHCKPYKGCHPHCSPKQDILCRPF